VPRGRTNVCVKGRSIADVLPAAVVRLGPTVTVGYCSGLATGGAPPPGATFWALMGEARRRERRREGRRGRRLLVWRRIVRGWRLRLRLRVRMRDRVLR
jgi:hypothetical protein